MNHHRQSIPCVLFLNKAGKLKTSRQKSVSEVCKRKKKKKNLSG